MKAKKVFSAGLVFFVVAVLLLQTGMAYSPTLFEYYNVGDNGQTSKFHDSDWEAQTFTVGSTPHTVTSVQLKLYKHSGSNPGTVTVSIRATDGSGHPVGGDFTSGTIDGNTLGSSSPGAWVSILVTEYTLLANMKYAICIRAANNGIYARLANPGTYPDGNHESSSNSGSSWATKSSDLMFEVWGSPYFITTTVTETTTITNSTTVTVPTTVTNTTTLTETSTVPTTVVNSTTVTATVTSNFTTTMPVTTTVTTTQNHTSTITSNVTLTVTNSTTITSTVTSPTTINHTSTVTTTLPGNVTFVTHTITVANTTYTVTSTTTRPTTATVTTTSRITTTVIPTSTTYVTTMNSTRTLNSTRTYNVTQTVTSTVAGTSTTNTVEANMGIGWGVIAIGVGAGVAVLGAGVAIALGKPPTPPMPPYVPAGFIQPPSPPTQPFPPRGSYETPAERFRRERGY